jgi:hypothetical protein
MNIEESEKINSEKEIQYYSALVNSWFSTKLEKDKTLITLSAGAIGLLVTLITAVGTSSLFVLFAFVSAILCFIISTISVIIVFDKNAKYLEKLKDNKDANDPLLNHLDRLAFFSFIVGIFLAFIIGLSAGIDQYSKLTGGQKMAEQRGNYSGNSLNQRSFNGAGNMSPSSTPSSQSGSSQSGNAGGNIGGNAGGNNSASGSSSQGPSSNSTPKK